MTTFTLKRWNHAAVAGYVHTSSPLLPQLRAKSQVLVSKRRSRTSGCSLAPPAIPAALRRLTRRALPNVAELPGRRSASFDTGGSQRDGEEAGESEASECSIPEELRQVISESLRARMTLGSS